MTTEYMQATAGLIQAQGDFLVKVAEAETKYAEVRKLDAETDLARTRTAALAEACRAMRGQVLELLRSRVEIREAAAQAEKDLHSAWNVMKGGQWSAGLRPMAVRSFERLAVAMSGAAPPVPVGPDVRADQFLGLDPDATLPPLSDAEGMARWMFSCGVLAAEGTAAAMALRRLHGNWAQAFVARRDEARKAKAELETRFGALVQALGVH